MELVPWTILNSLAYNAIYIWWQNATIGQLLSSIPESQAVKRKTAANKNVMQLSRYENLKMFYETVFKALSWVLWSQTCG